MSEEIGPFLESLSEFLIFFVVAAVLTILFVVIYTRVTRHNDRNDHPSVGRIGVDFCARGIPRRSKRTGVRLFRCNIGPRGYRTQHNRHRHRHRHDYGVWRTIVGHSAAAKLRFLRGASVRLDRWHCCRLARPQIQQVSNAAMIKPSRKARLSQLPAPLLLVARAPNPPRATVRVRTGGRLT